MSASGESLRILLVDDDADARDLAQFSLGDLGGHRIESVDTAHDLAARVDRIQPDLLLLDLHLDGDSGLDALESLRADGRHTQLPVVFVTGRDDEETLARCRAAGARGVIAKPYDPLTLGDQILALRSDPPPCGLDAPE